MRRMMLVVAAMLAGCSGAAFNRVRDVHTIEEARVKLEGYEPDVTRYGEKTEAWYFGRNGCVLFVDGKNRLTQTTETWVEGTSGMQPGEKKRAFCAPSQLE